MTATTRPYGGRSADERRAERRTRLLKATLEIWGDQGWTAVTVRGVCARAGLTVRYFYENFADVETLLFAAYDEGRDAVANAVWQAAANAPEGTEVRAALTVLVNTLAADPGLARIAMAEPAGSPALEQRRRETVALYANLLTSGILARPDDGTDPAAVQHAALFCVGGVEELLTTWLNGDLSITQEELIDECVLLCTNTLTRPTPQAQTP
ncbi:TetR/AcrR family transcriptional regulator [Actinomadura hibisca]|uniref:TetR/AcrR family transcriptional regulator n=1 Tax=Actinomadura hibisca TaxID=68565 RepID=UPI000830A142|nr:TetR/AcrR family transcriptional regulator [Actinomadura hibisca]